MNVTKEDIERIKERANEAKKDFKNRCFLVIETLVGDDMVCNDIEKLKEDVYKIAHIGVQTCENEHKDWVKETEELFIAFEKNGLI